jgi:hypothetical protein
LIFILELFVDYWFVFALIIVCFVVCSLNYSATKHNEGVESRRVERAKIISDGGPDPLLSSKEARKIIFYMFLAMLPIFIMFALVDG